MEQLTSELIELSRRQNFTHWLAIGAVQRRRASAAEALRCTFGWKRDHIKLLRPASDKVVGMLVFFGFDKRVGLAGDSARPVSFQTTNLGGVTGLAFVNEGVLVLSVARL